MFKRCLHIRRLTTLELTHCSAVTSSTNYTSSGSSFPQPKISWSLSIPQYREISCQTHSLLSKRGSTSNKFTSKEAQLQWEDVLESYPQLEEYPKSKVIDYMGFMSRYGIIPGKSAQVLLKYPVVLSRYETSIPEILSIWRSIGFQEKEGRKLLVRYPQLTSVPAKEITRRYDFLTSYMSKQEARDVIECSTEIILDHESIIKRKLIYLIKKASHSTKLISKCKALAFSLQHIRMRHEFLIRSGLFKPVPYNRLHKVIGNFDKPNLAITRDRYFVPEEVICLNDKDFLRCCTNNQLSLNELAAFEEIYNKEIETTGGYDEDLETLDAVEGESDDEEDEEYDDEHEVRANNTSGFFNKAELVNFYY